MIWASRVSVIVQYFGYDGRVLGRRNGVVVMVAAAVVVVMVVILVVIISCDRYNCHVC